LLRFCWIGLTLFDLTRKFRSETIGAGAGSSEVIAADAIATLGGLKCDEC
jgi:hypothetical protein